MEGSQYLLKGGEQKSEIMVNMYDMLLPLAATVPNSLTLPVRFKHFCVQEPPGWGRGLLKGRF